MAKSGQKANVDAYTFGIHKEKGSSTKNVQNTKP